VIAQNQLRQKLLIPANRSIVFRPKADIINPSAIAVLNFKEEPANTPLFLFNNVPVPDHKRNAGKPVLIFSELSFSDIFETALNSLKTSLVNTYDDQVTELFKDAPSLFKVKWIIPL